MRSRSLLRRPSGAAIGLLCLILAGGGAAGCAGKPSLIAGDANSAEVRYGSDLAATTAVAKDACARYEKVPRFLAAQDNVAYFHCERP
jgi:hypothetical protein